MSENGWDTWGRNVLGNQKEFKGKLVSLRNEVIELRVEMGRLGALFTEGRNDAKEALVQGQANKLTIEGLTVRTGMVAVLVSLLSTGLGVLFVYALSQVGQ